MDRNGTKIATSERVYNVILDANVMTDKEEYIEPTKEVLEECFGISPATVDEIIETDPDSQYEISQRALTMRRPANSKRSIRTMKNIRM